MVIAPDGQLLDILRIGLAECRPSHGIAAVLRADSRQPAAAMRFHSFIQLPSGSNSKTHILRDPVSRQYIAIGNICVDDKTPGQRNVLALQASGDLVNWRVVKILLDYRTDSPKETGFQYISFLFDGDDLCYLSRTAINGARNFHDANFITFHRLCRFRDLLKPENQPSERTD